LELIVNYIGVYFVYLCRCIYLSPCYCNLMIYLIVYISVAFLGTDTTIMGHASIHCLFLALSVDLVAWKDYEF
jgi:hypothetical protein